MYANLPSVFACACHTDIMTRNGLTFLLLKPRTVNHCVSVFLAYIRPYLGEGCIQGFQTCLNPKLALAGAYGRGKITYNSDCCCLQQ
jgi:hypothetical protein